MYINITYQNIKEEEKKLYTLTSRIHDHNFQSPLET